MFRTLIINAAREVADAWKIQADCRAWWLVASRRMRRTNGSSGTTQAPRAERQSPRDKRRTPQAAFADENRALRGVATERNDARLEPPLP